MASKKTATKKTATKKAPAKKTKAAPKTPKVPKALQPPKSSPAQVKKNKLSAQTLAVRPLTEKALATLKSLALGKEGTAVEAFDSRSLNGLEARGFASIKKRVASITAKGANYLGQDPAPKAKVSK
jgi:hypothetical protein